MSELTHAGGKGEAFCDTREPNKMTPNEVTVLEMIHRCREKDAKICALHEQLSDYKERYLQADENYRHMSAALGEQIDELQNEIAALREKHHDFK